MWLSSKMHTKISIIGYVGTMIHASGGLGVKLADGGACQSQSVSNRLLTADCRSNKLLFPAPRYPGASHACKPFRVQYSSGNRNVITRPARNFTPVISHLWSPTAPSKRLSSWRVVNFRIADNPGAIAWWPDICGVDLITLGTAQSQG